MSQTSESNSARPAGGKHDTESTDQTRVKWTLVGPGLVAAATGVGLAAGADCSDSGDMTF